MSAHCDVGIQRVGRARCGKVKVKSLQLDEMCEAECINSLGFTFMHGMAMIQLEGVRGGGISHICAFCEAKLSLES